MTLPLQPEPLDHPVAEQGLDRLDHPGVGTAAKVSERPHPLTPFVRGWVLILAIVFGVGRELLQRNPEGGPLPPLEWIASGIGAAVLIAVAAGFMSWRFTRFVIDADELRVDTGAVFKRSVRVAFDKVQSIDVVQPFAARLVGLSELQIDVGSQERVRLRYLKLTRAYALRDYLLARARGQRVEAQEHVQASSVLADLTEHDEVLVQVPPQTLFLAAVTSHEFFSIIGGGLVSAAVVTYLGWGWGALAILIPVASALFSFVSRRIIGQFNYTLSRREHGLRISRGLTSLTSQSLPPRRVQAAQITQSPIWRGLGLYRLDIAVIGWGGITNDENDTGVSTILLPAGNIDQVRAALGAIWPRTSFETIELQRPPQRARWRHPFAAPFMRWGHDDQLTVTRHGWLVRTWHLVPHARTQSVQITQGPFSRRLRLAELEFHTAGGTVQARARGLDADLVRGLQADLLARVHHLPELDLSEPTPPPRPSESLGDPGLRRDDDGELNQTLPEPVQGSAVARQTPPEAVVGSAVARQTPPEAVEGSATATTTVPGPVDSLRRGDAGDWPQTVGPDAFRADQADATISSTE